MITKEYLQQELRRRIDGIKPCVITTTDLLIGEMKSILVLVDALEDSEHLADARKTSPNVLEEAAVNWICNHKNGEVLYVKDAFIAGAKWQADHAPLPEDTVLFNKGVAEGKRLMMEEMSECFAQLKQVQSESINISAVREQLAYNRGASDERYKMRKKMIEEAIEYEVGMHGEPITINLDKYVQRARGIFPGDKVRIIIVKED